MDTVCLTLAAPDLGMPCFLCYFPPPLFCAPEDYPLHPSETRTALSLPRLPKSPRQDMWVHGCTTCTSADGARGQGLD
jgi:hypothetical protein